jgi:hypothetical protein
MMKRLFLQFMAISALLLTVSCSKDDDSDDPVYAVKAELDGEYFEAFQSNGVFNSQSSGGSVSIYAYNSEDKGFRFNLEETTTPGTYDLSGTEVGITYAKDAGASQYYSFDSGTITISSFEHTDGLTFTATFSGVASPNFSSDPDIEITNGSANIKF